MVPKVKNFKRPITLEQIFRFSDSGVLVRSDFTLKFFLEPL